MDGMEPLYVFFSSRSNPIESKDSSTLNFLYLSQCQFQILWRKGCQNYCNRNLYIDICFCKYSICEYWILVSNTFGPARCRRMPSTCAAESTPKTHRKPRWVPFHPCHPWRKGANSQGVQRLFWYLFHIASKRTEQYKICLFFCSFGLTSKLCTCRLCRYWFLPLALFWTGFWWTNKAANCCELRIILVAAHDVPVWNTYSNVFIVI